ncbi:MAG: GyrI-like domain-containing protein [Pseudomonadota bacterium]
MTDYQLQDVTEKDYIYIERTCSMDPQVVGKTMGEAFGAVVSFATEHGIALDSQPISVYHTYNPETLTFRAGFFIKPEDAAKASGEVRADKTPTGQVLFLTHVGPYSELRTTYGEAMAYIEQNGLKIGAPTWEVYVDDPTTTPEQELRTEIFMALA